MFKKTLFSGSLMATAQAIAITQPEIYSQTLSLAQTQAGNDCCCSYMPCMPTCNSPCNEHDREPSPPPPGVTVPAPIQDIVLNLDVILTHILHEVHPEQVPPPGTDEENDFVQNVITPVVIELINNDIAPAIPTCTYPEEVAATEDEEPRVHADPWEVMRKVLEESLGDLDLPEGMHADDIVNAALEDQAIVADLNLETEAGQETLQMVIQGLRTSVTEHLHQESTPSEVVEEVQETVEDVQDALTDNIDNLTPVSETEQEHEEVQDEAVSELTEQLIDGIEESGNDATGLEDQIQDIVEDAAEVADTNETSDESKAVDTVTEGLVEGLQESGNDTSGLEDQIESVVEEAVTAN